MGHNVVVEVREEEEMVMVEVREVVGSAAGDIVEVMVEPDVARRVRGLLGPDII